MKTISVFGSSQVRPGDPVYADAEALGRGLAQAGYAVMSGGYRGVMEAVSKGAREAGGSVIGVTTDQISSRFAVQPNAWLSEIHHYALLRDRLLHMVERADGYLAMPGGVGTLHEIAETWELLRIGALPRRPFVVYGEMWKMLIRELQATRFLAGGCEERYVAWALQPADAIDLLDNWWQRMNLDALPPKVGPSLSP
ncbi:MAG: LOG family protein [Chloroflexi bacterium]|nr:LOG family protein [Chloroflexota bacterium]MCY4246541.1 LOG family protein [Chloroflexota bacterium]